MITRNEILKGQEIPPEFEANLAVLLQRLNKFRLMYGKPMIVTSGYRTVEHNKAIGGAKLSRHCVCMACDFADKDGEIKAWVKDNPEILEICDLYMEDPLVTLTWIHLDTLPRKTRIFKP